MRCTGAFDPCAAATWRTMPARSVAWPTAVASQRSGPCSFTVPASTRSPGFFSTGRLSPVSIDSLTVDSPVSTRPSTGIVAPARYRCAGPTHEDAARMNVGKRHLAHIAALFAQNRRRLQREQLANRARGPHLRPPLEQLAEQHQRDHHGRSLEVDLLARQLQ